MNIMDMFGGAGDVAYEEHADQVRQWLTLIDGVARARLLANEAERSGAIADADTRMTEWIEECVASTTDAIKVERHAALLAMGIDDPSAHEDFVAGLSGMRKPRLRPEDGTGPKDDTEPKENA